MTLEGEEVDFNELQAQISLSLGTIRDMTSSWHSTSSKASNSTKQDDLREWMSRPSRLGLGASVAQTSASEIDVRLQRKLASKGPSVGNKVGNKVEEQSEQSDDEESKYRTTTKKTKNTAKKYLDKPHAVKKNVVGVDSNIQLSKKQRKKLNKKLKQQQQQTS